jgi:hypothetical protein
MTISMADRADLGARMSGTVASVAGTGSVFGIGGFKPVGLGGGRTLLN